MKNELGVTNVDLDGEVRELEVSWILRDLKRGRENELIRSTRLFRILQKRLAEAKRRAKAAKLATGGGVGDGDVKVRSRNTLGGREVSLTRFSSGWQTESSSSVAQQPSRKGKERALPIDVIDLTGDDE